MDEKADLVKERFRLKGSDLGSLLGSLATLLEGEEVSFDGKVFVKDDNENVSIYDGQLNLRLCSGNNDNYKNYRLIREDSFSVPIIGVGSFSLVTEKVHVAVPERRNLGPFLYADRRTQDGCVIIESKVIPFPKD